MSMKSLLVMTLSGSTMTVICLLLRLLLRNRVSARLYYLLARVAVLYYLIPLPFLKEWYREGLWVILPGKEEEIAQLSLTRISYAVHADGEIYANFYAKIQTALVIVWFSVACLLMARQLLIYLRTARRIAIYTERQMTDRHRTFLVKLQKQYGVKRHVALYHGRDGEPAMTFGVCRPVIICGREIGSREAELMVRHELVHIRRLDALWKILMQFATFLHWCNPMVWVLYFELDRVCELSCDETAMQGRPEEEIDAYLRLLIEEVQTKEEAKRPSLKWKAGFGDNKRKIRERMDNLMRHKRGNRFLVGMLAAALVFANSITVFAYEDTFHEYMPEDASEERVERVLEDDTFLFVPDEAGGDEMQEFNPSEIDEIRYDAQFTDEEGNIYPIFEEAPAETYRGCNHVFVSGTEARHKKNSDGSCVVTQYRAQRCSKCGTVIQGDWISTTNYAVCPH